eukprot:1289223-Pyramimonas_sp.AAC.1
MSGNISAVASSLGVDRRELPNKLRLIASSLIHVDRALRSKTEAVCAQLPRVRKLLFVDFAAYDETPMQIVVPGSLDAAQKGKLALTLGGVGGQDLDVLPRFPESVGAITEKTHSTSKLLQSEQKFGMLLEIEGVGGGLPEASESTYMFILGDTICGLQQIESTKGTT